MADPKIKFKRSSVPGKRPTADQVPLGEAALNTFDGRLYVSKSTDGGITTSVVNLSGFNLQDEGTFVGYANTVNFVGGTISVGVDTNVGIATVTVTGGGVGIQSAGTVIGYGITTLNFIGAGNTFKVTGSTVDISIQGGGGGGTGGGEIGIQANNTLVAYAQTTLNFAGTGVTAVSIGKTTTITIEPGLVGAAKSAYSFTATAGQTVFNVNYSQGQENVFRNGVRLSENGDYTATNGSQIILTNPANAGDQIDVVVYLRGSDPQRNINVSLAPSFNGITTAFTMYSAGLVFNPLDERQIIVSVGGVVQQPGVAYTVGAGASIYFSSAPSIGATCFITALYSYSAQRTSVNVDGGYGNLTSINVSGVTTTAILNVGAAGTVITTSGIGSVGIGTTIPRYRLDVNGDINFTGTFYQGGSQFVASRWTAGTGNDIYRLLGNIGIGTTNPTAKLDVVGNAKVSGVVTATSFSGECFNAYPFYTGITSSVFATPTGVISPIISFPADSTKRYIIHSINVANKARVQPLGAAATVTVGTSGTITAITLNYPGTGYKVAPAVSIASTVGSGATITSRIDSDGKVIGFTVLFAGTGYEAKDSGNLVVAKPGLAKTDVGVSVRFDRYPVGGGTTVFSYIAFNTPIPTGGVVEILKQPQVMNPLDQIEIRGLAADGTGLSNAIDVLVSYEEIANTNYIGFGTATPANIGIGTTVSNIRVLSATDNPFLLQSLRLTNTEFVGDYDVSIKVVTGAGQTYYLARDLMIPSFASVELCDAPKRIEKGSTIFMDAETVGVDANIASTIDIQVSGRNIT